MIRKLCPPLLLTFVAISLRAQYDVRQSDSPVISSSLPPQVLFDLHSASPAARKALLPLYEQEWATLQKLSQIKWEALHETLGGLLIVAAGTSMGSAGAVITRASAAKAGTPGAKFEGENAALAAEEPAEMPASVKQAMHLVDQVKALDDAIGATQTKYGIASSARTPWSVLFPASKPLTPSQVTDLLKVSASRLVVTSSEDVQNFTEESVRNMSYAQYRQAGESLEEKYQAAGKAANHCRDTTQKSCFAGCGDGGPNFGSCVSRCGHICDSLDNFVQKIVQLQLSLSTAYLKTHP